MPVLLALFVNLAFGNIFTDRAKLGIYDEGSSQLVAILSTDESIITKIYENESSLKSAAARGAIDMGIKLPSDFDNTLASGTVKLKAYIWGESLAKNRTIVPVVLADAVHRVTGKVSPVNIETVPLGEESNIPWSDRLFPLTVLLAVFFGGLMIPASSLINEKQRGTLVALSISPASIGEIFTAKGFIGAFLALVMAVLTLAISGAINSSFPSLILVLGLGAVLAVEIGLLAGALIKDMNTLFAFWKFGGLLLFGPAIVFMFPDIPSWLGYIFPTYYVIKPVIDLSINSMGFNSIILPLVILIAIVFLMGLVVSNVVGRLSTRALRLNG
jgi:ABC-2 type transport system permease protein